MEGTGLELILNASEGVLQICVTRSEKALAFQEWFLPDQGAELLAPALEQLASRLGIRPDEFRRIACVAGPGSFTGIRLVLATAAGLRRAGHAQLAGLDYLQALATTAVKWRGLPYGAKVWVVTHARRSEVHVRQYLSFGPIIPAQPVTPLRLLEPQKAYEKMLDDPGCVCGSGLMRHQNVFFTSWIDLQDPKTGLTLLPELVSPSLGSLCLLARHGDYFPRDVEPVYAREVDAVENLQGISEKAGRNPDKDRQALAEMLVRSPESEI